MPERWYYASVLVACVGITLPLEWGLGARVYRQPRRAAMAVLPVFVVFAAWDIAATRAGHWHFSDRYVLGPRWFGLPVEEWLFFVVIPLCALLTYEAVGRMLRPGTSVDG